MHPDQVARACRNSTVETRLMSDDPFIALRVRAYDLADTGRFRRWDEIAYALQAEGFPPALITRLHQDELAVMMITRCCDMARSRLKPPQPPL